MSGQLEDSMSALDAFEAQTLSEVFLSIQRALAAAEALDNGPDGASFQLRFGTPAKTMVVGILAEELRKAGVR